MRWARRSVGGASRSAGPWICSTWTPAIWPWPRSAYEVRGSASHLLASPNVSWASFNYDNLLPEIKEGQTGREIGEIWLDAEAERLGHSQQAANTEGYPHTFTLLDLDGMDGVAQTAMMLADALRVDIAAARPRIDDAHRGSDRYDSDFDGDLDRVDSYTDLLHFAEQLHNAAVAAPIRTASAQVVDAVSEAVVAPISEAAHLGPIQRRFGAGNASAG